MHWSNHIINSSDRRIPNQELKIKDQIKSFVCLLWAVACWLTGGTNTESIKLRLSTTFPMKANGFPQSRGMNFRTNISGGAATAGTSTTRKRISNEQEVKSFFESISKAKQFILRIMPAMINTSYSRGRGFAYFLILCNTIQQAAFAVKANADTDSLDVAGYIVNSFDYTILHLEGSKSAKEVILAFFLTLNTFLLLTPAILCACFTIRPFKVRKLRHLPACYCFISKIYNEILLIPSFVCTMSIFSDASFDDQVAVKILAFISAFTSLLFGMVMADRDFEYSYSPADYLSRRESQVRLWIVLVQPIIIGCNFWLGQAGVSILLIGMQLFKIVTLNVVEDLMVVKEIAVFYFRCSIVLFVYTCVMAMHFDGWIENIFLPFITMIPLAMVLADVSSARKRRVLFLQCIGKNNLNHLNEHSLDSFVGILVNNLNFYYEDYIEKGQALVFETIFVHHMLTCTATDYKCFCFQFRRKDDSEFNLAEYIGEEYRRTFVVFYIVDIFEKYLLDMQRKKKKNTRVMFMYLSFLFEVMRISTKAFSEIYTFQNTLVIGAKQSSFSLLSLRELFYTQILISRNNLTFRHFFRNPLIQNQRIHMMAVITFDERIAVLREKLSDYMNNMARFLDFLCSNYIDLLQLEEESNTLHAANSVIRELLHQLFDIHPNSKELHFIAGIFNQLFDFEDTKLNKLIRKSKHTTVTQLLPSEKTSITVFNANSCVVYASLKTVDGRITKVSNSFQRIYNIENNMILGKTINSLIPKGLYGAHDDFLKNFRNHGTMNVIKKGQRLVFGLSGRGFIMPLFIRLRLENMFGEFGVCSHLTRANIDKDYLFFSNEGDILDISENLFNRVFKSICPLSQIRLLNINNVIPLSYGVQQLEEFEQIFHSILVVKRKEAKLITQIMLSQHNNSRATMQKRQIQQSQKDSLKFPPSDEENEELNRDQKQREADKIEEIAMGITHKDLIYNITFQMSLIPTSLGKTFKFVEIESFNRETSRSQKAESIKQLQDCITLLIAPYKKAADQPNCSNDVAQGIPTRSGINNSKRQTIFQQSQKRELDFVKQLIGQSKQIRQQSQQNQGNQNEKKQNYSNNNDDSIRNKSSNNSFSSSNSSSNSSDSETSESESKQSSEGFTHVRKENPNSSQLDQNIEFPISIERMDEIQQQQLQQQQHLQLQTDRENPNMLSVENQPFLTTKRSNNPIGSPTSLNEPLFFSSNNFQNEQDPSSSYLKLVKDSAKANAQEERKSKLKTHTAQSHLKIQEYNQRQSRGNQKNHGNNNNNNIFSDAINQNPKQKTSLPNITSLSKIMSNKQQSNEHNEGGVPSHNKFAIPSHLPVTSQRIIIASQNEVVRASTTSDGGMGDGQGGDNEGAELEVTSLRSASAGSSSVLEQKKRIAIRQIKSEALSKGLKFFVTTGIFSFLALSLLSTILHVSTTSTLSQIYDNFLSLKIFNLSLCDLLRTLASSSYRLNNLGKTYPISPASLFKSEDALAETDSNIFRTSFIEQFIVMSTNVPGSEYQTAMYDMRTSFKTYSRNSSYIVVNSAPITNIPVLYSFAQNIFHLNNVHISFSNTLDLRQIWENYVNYSENASTLQSIVSNQVSSQFDSIVSISWMNLLVILGVTLLLVFTLLPISIIISTQKEQILKLFGSFPPEKVNKHIEMIENAIAYFNEYTSAVHEMMHHRYSNNNNQRIEGGIQGNGANDFFEQREARYSTSDEEHARKLAMKRRRPALITNDIYASLPNNNNSPYNQHHRLMNNSKLFGTQKQMNWANAAVHDDIQQVAQARLQKQRLKHDGQKRNRSIASFSSIPKVNKLFVISSLVIIVSLLIFPIISITIVQSFKNESALIMQERLILLECMNRVFDEQANFYTVWAYAKLQPNLIVRQDRIQFHMNRIYALLLDTSTTFQQLNDLLVLSKQHTFETDLYSSVVDGILSGNACETMKVYSSYFSSREADTADTCVTSGDGSMQKGMIITMKNIKNIFEGLASISGTSIEQMNTFMVKLAALQSSQNYVIDLNTLIRHLAFAAEGLDAFFVDHQYRVYEDLRKKELILFCFSIVTICVLFSFGWYLLFIKLRKDLIKAKSLLTLFHINLILQNNVFLQFLKQNTFGVDGAASQN